MSATQLWYTTGVNKHLSDNGFVHFITGERMDEDYEAASALTAKYKKLISHKKINP